MKPLAQFCEIPFELPMRKRRSAALQLALGGAPAAKRARVFKAAAPQPAASAPQRVALLGDDDEDDFE